MRQVWGTTRFSGTTQQSGNDYWNYLYVVIQQRHLYFPTRCTLRIQPTCCTSYDLTIVPQIPHHSLWQCWQFKQMKTSIFGNMRIVNVTGTLASFSRVSTCMAIISEQTRNLPSGGLVFTSTAVRRLLLCTSPLLLLSVVLRDQRQYRHDEHSRPLTASLIHHIKPKPQYAVPTSQTAACFWLLVIQSRSSPHLICSSTRCGTLSRRSKLTTTGGRLSTSCDGSEAPG